MKVLHLDNMSRWYALWWDTAEKCLFIKIYRHFINAFEYPDLARLFWTLENEGGEDLFTKCETRLGQRTFGYGQHIQQTSEDTKTITYKITIPQILFETGKACQECGGTGERSEGQRCIWCNGTKREKVHVWKNANQLCESLQVLFSALYFHQEVETDSKEYQWFTVTAGIGDRGCYLGGELSPAFVDLLRSKSRSRLELKEVTDAQMSAFEQMMGASRLYDRYCFNAWLDNGNLVINCPGDACGIHPSPSVQNIHSGCGVEITCHNLDSPHQLITLLCGWGAVARMFMNL